MGIHRQLLLTDENGEQRFEIILWENLQEVAIYSTATNDNVCLNPDEIKELIKFLKKSLRIMKDIK